MKIGDMVKSVGAAPLLLAEMRGLRKELRRLADLYERDLADRGVLVKQEMFDVTGDEPVVEYTDELYDLAREVAEKYGAKVKE